MLLCVSQMYEVGASNLGHIVLYTVLNETEGLLCDRSYLPAPDMQARPARRADVWFGALWSPPLASPLASRPSPVAIAGAKVRADHPTFFAKHRCSAETRRILQYLPHVFSVTLPCPTLLLAFYDLLQGLLARHKKSLFAVESKRPLRDFDTVGLSLAYELVRALPLRAAPTYTHCKLIV